MSLTDLQIRDFVERGYTTIPGLIDIAVISSLREELDAFALGSYQLESVEPPGVGGLPASDSGVKMEGRSKEERLNAIQTVHFPHWVSAPLRDLVESGDLLRALGTLAEAQIGGPVDGMTCIQSFVFYRHSQELGKAWHQDETYIKTADGSLTGVWIALDDATIENGCLWFIPGSHSSRHLFPMSPHSDPTEYDYALTAQGFDTGLEVPVEVVAGDAVVFNGYLLHRSGRNRSASWRRAIATHYMNSRLEPRWSMPNGLVWPPKSAGVTWRAT